MMSSQTVKLFKLLVYLAVATLPILVSGTCPQETPEFHRLGKTRFYIYDKGGEPDRSMNVNWQEAKEKCIGHSERFDLASSLKKISTNAIIARTLEVLAQRLDLKETVYWMDAVYNAETETYQWSNTSDIQYGNFFYHQPRPVGLRGHLIKNSHTKERKRQISLSDETETDGDTDIEKDEKLDERGKGDDEENLPVIEEDQCLAYTLPYRNNPMMGWQASWVEKDCSDRDHRRVLCESQDSACEKNANKDPHVLTEDKEYYFTEGNWIFANRRFIVNWKQQTSIFKRTKAEAEEYCKKYDLDVFAPVLEDNCLIPYLKLWAPVISTYQFWTSYSYHPEEHEYRNKNGKIQKGPKQIDKYHHMGNSHKEDKQHCVTYQWSFEMINETRCNCDWMYYVLVPAKCENYVGTICRHKVEDNTRICDFQREWLDDFSQALGKTAVVEFGYQGSGFWRSTYKQTFGSRICGDTDRQMIDSETEYWSVDPTAVEYTYDYEETYWIVDEDLFKHAGEDAELCSVSVGTYDKAGNKFSREIRKVNCNEWHFYLCELNI